MHTGRYTVAKSPQVLHGLQREVLGAAQGCRSPRIVTLEQRNRHQEPKEAMRGLADRRPLVGQFLAQAVGNTAQAVEGDRPFASVVPIFRPSSVIANLAELS